MTISDLIETLTTLDKNPLSSLNGAGNIIVTLGNLLLPENSKLTLTTSGEEALAAFQLLPVEHQTLLTNLLKEFAYTKKEEPTLITQNELEMFRIMEETDRQNGLRPKLALVFGYVGAGFSAVISTALAYRWIRFGEVPSWEILFISSYLPIHVTLAYFKIRSDDKQLKTAFISQGKIAPRMKMSDAITSLLTKKL